MARLVSSNIEMGSAHVRSGSVAFRGLLRAGRPVVVNGLPLIFWNSGQQWREANDYLYSRSALVASSELHVRTVHAEGLALYAFAKWLESEKEDWTNFPARREERCLVRYKAALLQAAASEHRSIGRLRRSTAAARMRVALHFYRWASSQGILGPVDLEETHATFRIYNEHGFGFAKPVLSSNLAIRNSKLQPDDGRLESGAHPVSVEQRDQILAIARERMPIELCLMLQLGFATGLRLGTIGDLKIQTLEHAVPIQGVSTAMVLSVGPQATPPVATKFGRNGKNIVIPTWLRNEILEYSSSRRRMTRELRAQPEDRDLVFLTRSGKRFVAPTMNRSPTVNALMTALRRKASASGIDIQRFTFHCTRATFATAFAELGIAAGRIDDTVAFLREVMLHRDEATTWRYIRYVQQEGNRGILADRFTRETFGLATGAKSPFKHDKS